MDTTRRSFCVAATGALFAASSSAKSSGVVKLLVGFAPGGAMDSVARVLAEGLKAGGYTVIVDNRPGAAGKLAIDALKGAPADGRTLMLAPGSAVTMERGLYAKPRFDLYSDLLPLAAVAQVSQALAVGPATTARTLKDFLSWCRSNPEKATYATAGVGTSQQFLAAELSRASGVPLTHVPYRGGSLALPDVMGGQVTSIFIGTPPLRSLHQHGQLTILAVTSTQRLKSLPNVPTFAEAGYPSLTEEEQFGLFLPAHTPKDVVARLADAVMAAVQSEAYRTSLEKLEFQTVFSGPSAYEARLRIDALRWEALIRKSGFTPQS